MAIIDAKRLEADEEAERNARVEAEEYASRHDTAASWQNPPPAYEEAAGQSSSSSTVNVTNSNSSRHFDEDENCPYETEIGQDNDGRRSSRRSRSRRDSRRSARFTEEANRETNRSQRSEYNEEDEEDEDESSPLLSRRQRLLLQKRLKFKSKYRRACRFLFSFLLLGIIIIMCLKLFLKNKNRYSNEKQPNPWPTDGRPIENPDWSPIKEAQKETWTSQNIPEYLCSTNFSLSANSSLNFFRAHGSSYFGSTHIVPSSSTLKEDLRTVRGWQEGLDRIAVVIEAKFTSDSLLNSVRIDKMIEDKHSKKINEGISMNSDRNPPRNGQFISFEIYIVLPSPSLRSNSGLARDGSSFIPGFQFFSDSLRLAFEDLAEDVPKEDQAGISFGTIEANTKLGGITLAMLLKANESANLHVDSGSIRDLVFRGKSLPLNIIAPKVKVTTVTGAIWITGLVGIESVDIHTVTGGLNISNIAVAKRVSSSTNDGVLGGRYSAFNSIDINSFGGQAWVDVIADSQFYSKMLDESGLLNILEPKRSKQIKEEIRITNKSPWRTMSVQAQTRSGSPLVHYHDQDEKTLLLSNITTITGLAEVYHSKGFEGEFEIKTQIGSIQIKEPPKSNDPKIEKNFIIDFEEGNGGIGKLIKGRIWSKSHNWEKSKLPISQSKVSSNIGHVQAQFS